MIRSLTAAMSGAGARARLSVFIFHRVLEVPDPMQPDEPCASRFSTLVDWITRQFRVLPPLEACERWSTGRLPTRAAIITFDDGYEDNERIALPVLRNAGVDAAFFVATGFLNGGTMFNDRIIEALRRTRGPSLDGRLFGLGVLPTGSTDQRREAARRLIIAVKHMPQEERDAACDRIIAMAGGGVGRANMMTDEAVRRLHRAGMVIGGHTRTHPILRSVDDAHARAEIEGGRDDLRALVGESPRLFAYPNGKLDDDFDIRHRDMVAAAGFDFAFTTHPGAGGPGGDPLLLPRFTPWDHNQFRFGLRAAANLRRLGPRIKSD